MPLSPFFRARLKLDNPTPLGAQMPSPVTTTLALSPIAPVFNHPGQFAFTHQFALGIIHSDLAFQFLEPKINFFRFYFYSFHWVNGQKKLHLGAAQSYLYFVRTIAHFMH